MSACCSFVRKTWVMVVAAAFVAACGGGDAQAPTPAPAAPAAKSDQTVRFTSVAPTSAYVGGPTYTVTASAQPSGLPVTFALDTSRSTGCAINGSTVSFTGTGTCVIDAFQAGDDRYNAAPRIQQWFNVAAAAYTIDQLAGANIATYAAGAFGGQTFLVPTTARLNRLEAYLQSAGTLRAEVYAVDGSGAPTGGVLATSDTVPGPASTAVATSLAFSTPAVLEANKRYAVVIVGSTTYSFVYSNTDVYAGGTGIQQTGGPWAVVPTADIKFQLFMGP